MVDPAVCEVVVLIVGSVCSLATGTQRLQVRRFCGHYRSYALVHSDACTYSAGFIRSNSSKFGGAVRDLPHRRQSTRWSSSTPSELTSCKYRQNGSVVVVECNILIPIIICMHKCKYFFQTKNKIK
jgi:hypothetical protein